MYLCTGPRRIEYICIAYLAIVSTIAPGLPPASVYPGSLVVIVGAYVGLCSLPVLAFRAARGRGSRAMFFRCLALIGTGISIDRLLVLNSHLAVLKLDRYLYALDLRTIGFEPGFALAASGIHRYLLPIESFTYYSLPLATTLVYAGHIRAAKPRSANFLLIATANMIIGYALYMFYPAAGPVYAFPGSFGAHAPVLRGVYAQAISAPANAMPSLHISAALLIWWNSRHLPWARRVAMAYLCLTVLATLGLGEHYFLDLVVAVPYALFIQAIGERGRSRLTSVAAGAGIVAAWLFALRFGFSVLSSSPCCYVPAWS